MIPTAPVEQSPKISEPADIGVVAVDTGKAASSENGLTDATLLQICRILESDPQVTPEWLADLRWVSRLVEQARLSPASRPEQAMALLAWLLSQLPQYEPTHFPFGYTGPEVRSAGWIDRETLEQIGKQIVGLIWYDRSPDAVACTVEAAVSEAIHVGFLEQQRYDAWRPGMPSGSGWRAAITPTPYGVMKSRRATVENPTADGPPEFVCTRIVSTAGERRTGLRDGSLASVGAFSKINELPSASEAFRDAKPPAPSTQNNGAGNAGPPPTPLSKPSDTPAVQLGRPGETCVVLGNSKKPLTDGQYAVVTALLRAGDEGLNKDGLEAVRASARRILKQLREDADWAEVVVMPGQTNGRYRIRT